MTAFRPTQPVRRSLRALRLVAALGVAALLVACQADELGYGYGPKDQRPIPRQTVTLMSKLDMRASAPVLMRIFKEENKFEVWKMTSSGRYALLKSYDICKWSGALGPKVREGDRQAPEGFYPISPGLMNPKSDWYLAFNTGFPNAYDRANGRTGSALMVHGSCSSRGCYAMTDPQIQEIYALAREAFRGGQRAFQLQAFPFRLTAENMAKHWNDPNMPFWKMLKEGYDTFEMTRLEPKVDVCGRKYVFNANPPSPLGATDDCPADLGQPAALVASLASKAKADYAQAELLFAQIEADRKAEEEKKVQLALAAEKKAADDARAKAEAEARRIEAERNPGAIARLLGAEPNPDAGIVPVPVVVPPTGAPVPVADPRGPGIRALALAAPAEPPARSGAISRLLSLVTGDDDQKPAPGAIAPVAAAPATASGAIVPAAPQALVIPPPLIQPAPGAPTLIAPTATAPRAAPVVAAPVVAAAPPARPAPAADPQPVVVPAIACAPPGQPATPGTPPCPPTEDPAAEREKGILDRIGSWF